MKVKLKKNEKMALSYRASYIPWTSCLPFIVNPNAVLTHRVRWAGTHHKHGVPSHHACTYW